MSEVVTQSIPDATVVIVTRNRREIARRAVESALLQIGALVQVLVYDDASEDGTCEWLASSCPGVKVIRSDVRRGYIKWRNQGFIDAAASIVFSLDDDAYFTSTDTVASVLKYFEEDRAVGVVAIAYEESPLSGSLSKVLSDRQQLRSYRGCAHAIRKDAAVSSGLYREFLIHQGEERDLAIRMIDHGWSIVYAKVTPIAHIRSSIRDVQRINYYGYRNTILFEALNAPRVFVIQRMLIATVGLLVHKPNLLRLPIVIAYLMAGWWYSIVSLPKRRPVKIDSYRRFRGLPVHWPARSG